MGKVIGLKGTPDTRYWDWLYMRENRDSYHTFRNNSGEQEQAIAIKSQEVYNHYLNKYVGEAA